MPNEIYLQSKKEEGITILLNFLFSGLGHIYLGGKYFQKGLMYLIINFVLAVLSIATGFFILLWIPFWILVMIDGSKLTKEYNSSIIKEFESVHEVQSQAETDKIKIKSMDFVRTMEKTHKLFENELLTREEFQSRKEKLINELYINKIYEQPEDFLTSIISLKEKNILTQEELQKIKAYIL